MEGAEKSHGSSGCDRIVQALAASQAQDENHVQYGINLWHKIPKGAEKSV